MFATIVTLLFMFVGIAGSPSKSDGITYAHEQRAEPRPLQIHHLRIDLHVPGLEVIALIADDPDGAGVAEAALTKPMELVKRGGAVAAVNANAFSPALPRGQGLAPAWTEKLPVDISGWALNGERKASPPMEACWSFWIGVDGSANIGNPAEASEARIAIAGFGPLIVRGKITPTPDKTLHPRTALGLSGRGRYLHLVVVDGRQNGYSEGMSLFELAELMKELGCDEAINLDGGGSSVMILEDQEGAPAIMNRPSDRGTRPIPTMLAVKRAKR